MAKHNNKNPKCKCGVNDPLEFDPNNKSTCKSCIKIRQNEKNNRNRKEFGTPTMSPEQQEIYANTPMVSGRVRELREIYG